jgi:hypothetical protein
MAMNHIFQNVTKVSFVKGTSILVVLVGIQGPYLTKWGLFGFHLSGFPLWCFGFIAAIGGILFFLWPMIYGSDPIRRTEQSSGKTEKVLFLYLRAFELDTRNFLQLMVGASAGILVYAGLLEGMWYWVAVLPLFVNISKEQTFKDVLEPLGEFMAFGKPKERLRPIGASRIYGSNDWKQEIMEYITQARLIIIRPGKGESIGWEIQTVLQNVPPERILFYLRFRGRKQNRNEAYKKFRDIVSNACPAKLPEGVQKFHYLLFDANWNVYFLREDNRPLQLISQIMSSSGDIIVDRWRPILSALNIESPPRSNNWFNKVLTIFLWLVAVISANLVFLAILYAVIKIGSALLLYLLSQLIRVLSN